MPLNCSGAFAHDHQQSTHFGGMGGGIPSDPFARRRIWCPHMALKDTEIRAFRPLDKPYRKADSGGLYLEVFPNGSKLWRWKFRVAGKEKRLALGAYPAISLMDGRPGGGIVGTSTNSTGVRDQPTPSIAPHRRSSFYPLPIVSASENPFVVFSGLRPGRF